jgi:hypothetical protein
MQSSFLSPPPSSSASPYQENQPTLFFIAPFPTKTHKATANHYAAKHAASA